MKVTKLDKFLDARGWSLNDIYKKFRISAADQGNYQVNYSVLYPGIIKAWHRHARQDDYFCVLHGTAQVGVYNPKTGEASKLFIGDQNPAVVHIQAGEWHGLTAVGPQPVGLLYLVSNQYDPDDPDEERCDFQSFVGQEWWLPKHN
jgi:dTDP-4-dehydrorhamnose 3,5-epimerase